MAFETNVFINCPFDDAYLPLLRPILSAVIDLGFTPRIALESLDSGAPRLARIIELIEQSRFSIHDISRLRATSKGEYFRLNMPFEIGLDIGRRLFGQPPANSKQCLILEAEPYRYRAAISDISSCDIATHGGEPARAMTAVRDWLNTQARLRAAGPAKLWGRFGEFTAFNYDRLIGRGYSSEDIARLPVAELIDDIDYWAQRHPG